MKNKMATITQQESEILKKISDTITQFKKAYDENQRNARLKTESTRNINSPRRSKLKCHLHVDKNKIK